MKFGQRLAQLRKNRGLSQYELADRLSFSRGQIANYEQGQREPDFDTLRIIADFFNVSIDYLLGRNTSAPEEIDPEWVELYETLKSKSAEMEATTMLRSVGRLSKGQIKSILQVLEMIEAEEAEEEKGTDNKGD